MVDPLFLDFAMGIIAYFLLGIPLNRQTNPIEGPAFEPQKIYQALAGLEKQVLEQSITQIKWLEYLPTKKGRAYSKAKLYLKEFLSPRIDLALHLAKNEEDKNSRGVSREFKESIVVQMAKQPAHSQETLIADMRVALFAGHDTTSHTLSFALGELALNPEVFKKARQIVDRVMDKGILTVESLAELTYIEAIFKETMRLHSYVCWVFLSVLIIVWARHWLFWKQLLSFLF